MRTADEYPRKKWVCLGTTHPFAIAGVPCSVDVDFVLPRKTGLLIDLTQKGADF
jgi:hypothetical protein